MDAKIIKGCRTLMLMGMGTTNELFHLTRQTSFPNFMKIHAQLFNMHTERMTSRLVFMARLCPQFRTHPVPNALSLECPRASIAARRRAAGSIRISRRASCCCSSATAGIAIGANFKIYLLRKFCSNRVDFFTIHRRHRRKSDGPEF